MHKTPNRQNLMTGTIRRLLQREAWHNIQNVLAKLYPADISLAMRELDEKSRLLLFDQIKDLEKAMEIKGNIIWESPYYFLEKDNKKDGPFCQLCYDKEKLVIHLHEGKKGSWSCHSCEKVFRDDSYVATQNQIKTAGRRSWVKDY